MQSPITNDCLKVYIDDHYETQLVPGLLLKLSVQELHNIMLSTPEEGGLNGAIDADNNIIIIDSMLQSMIPPQIKKMPVRYKVMCGFE